MIDLGLKDIVNDLVESKLKLKEQDYIIKENVAALKMKDDIIKEKDDKLKEKDDIIEKLTAKFTTEVNKWKTMVVSYNDDYRRLYLGAASTDSSAQKNIVIEPENVKQTEEVTVTPVSESVSTSEPVTESVTNIANVVTAVAPKTRAEYMKEYMRARREKQKEERRKVVVNKEV